MSWKHYKEAFYMVFALNLQGPVCTLHVQHISG